MSFMDEYKNKIKIKEEEGENLIIYTNLMNKYNKLFNLSEIKHHRSIYRDVEQSDTIHIKEEWLNNIGFIAKKKMDDFLIESAKEIGFDSVKPIEIIEFFKEYKKTEVNQKIEVGDRYFENFDSNINFFLSEAFIEHIENIESKFPQVNLYGIDTESIHQVGFKLFEDIGVDSYHLENYIKESYGFDIKDMFIKSKENLSEFEQENLTTEESLKIGSEYIRKESLKYAMYEVLEELDKVEGLYQDYSWEKITNEIVHYYQKEILNKIENTLEYQVKRNDLMRTKLEELPQREKEEDLKEKVMKGI